MEAEANVNMPIARIGSSSKYDPTARFVLKILPYMIRDKAYFDSRIATKLTAEPKKNWLGAYSGEREQLFRFKVNTC